MLILWYVINDNSQCYNILHVMFILLIFAIKSVIYIVV